MKTEAWLVKETMTSIASLGLEQDGGGYPAAAATNYYSFRSFIQLVLVMQWKSRYF